MNWLIGLVAGPLVIAFAVLMVMMYVRNRRNRPRPIDKLEPRKDWKRVETPVDPSRE